MEMPVCCAKKYRFYKVFLVHWGFCGSTDLLAATLYCVEVDVIMDEDEVIILCATIITFAAAVCAQKRKKAFQRPESHLTKSERCVYYFMVQVSFLEEGWGGHRYLDLIRTVFKFVGLEHVCV